MSNFPIHTIQTAPDASKPALEGLQSAFGFIPNIAAAMATSPVLINSLVALFHQVHGDGKSFAEPQIEIVLLTDAVTNGSTWAAAFHSYLAISKGVPASEVQAIRDGELPKDAKFAALSRLAKTLIEKRGRLNAYDKDVFLQAGFTPNQLLEVVAIVAASTITNYTASITQPPLEANFQPHAWTAY
jgi:alkylhydroperoxidase family enzyme